MSGFSNTVVGGMKKLIRAAIQSPNYVLGSSGWTINKDGSAEFNNLTVRGTFSGIDFIINSKGEFYYSGTPALGNLIYSNAVTAGTDSYGNPYQQEPTVYGGGNSFAQLKAAGLNFNTGDSSEYSMGFISSQIVGGLGTRQLATYINSPGFSGNLGEITLASDSYDLSLSAYFDVALGSNNSSFYVGKDSNGNPIVGVGGIVTPEQPGTTNPETWHTISSGFPSGWSGTLKYRYLPTNDVQLDWNLSIVNGTSVTNGESINVSLPSAYHPITQKFLVGWTNAGGTGQGTTAMELDTGGTIRYKGGASTTLTQWIGTGIYTLGT